MNHGLVFWDSVQKILPNRFFFFFFLYMQNIVNDFQFYGDSNIKMLGELWGKKKKVVLLDCCILSIDAILWSSTSYKSLHVKEDFLLLLCSRCPRIQFFMSEMLNMCMISDKF